MKRLLPKGLLWCILLLLASSCIDIQESVYLRNNGSGKFAFTVNLEDMESLLSLIAKASGEEDIEEEMMSDMDVNFEKLKQKLEKQKGISQVKTIKENNNKLLGVAFEFSDINALNKALQEISDDKKNPTTEYFSFSNGQLKRINTLGVKEQVQRKIETDVDIAIDGVLLGSLLKEMTYTTKYTFEKPVKKTTNPGSKITNEGRTVSVTYHFFDTESATNSLENNISF